MSALPLGAREEKRLCELEALRRKRKAIGLSTSAPLSTSRKTLSSPEFIPARLSHSHREKGEQ